jgi:hypothetical protein
MPLKVKLPNGAALKSFATADLLCENLNRQDGSTHLSNGLAQHSILSCGQMYDAGYKALFEEGEAKLINGNIKINGNIVMQGQRDRET